MLKYIGHIISIGNFVMYFAVARGDRMETGMKRFLSLVLALAMLVGCIGILSSCGSEEDDGAQISVYLGDEVYDFDPTDYYADANAEQVMSLLYEPLFRLTSRGKLKCAAADSYEVDKDARTITIELRESYWSNGIRVQANDFVFAWTNILNPENANPAAALFYDIEGAVDVKNEDMSIYDSALGIKAESAYKLKITYRQGADYEQLLKNLASVAASPVNQSAYESDPDRWSKKFDAQIFNGPFAINRLDYDENEFTLVRNLGYHQNPVEAKRVDKYVTPAVLFSSFSSDEVLKLTYKDIEERTVFFMGDASLADRAENKKRADVVDTLSTYTYVFNTTNPFLANKNVRRALTIAIDRAAIVNAVTFGKAATGFIPDACEDFRKTELLSSSADTAKAKELLSKVEGLAAMDKSIELVVDNNEAEAKIAELVKASWEALGVGITVTVTKAAPVSHTVQTGDVVVEYFDSGVQALVKEASAGVYNFDVLGVDWMMYSEDAFVGLASLSTGYGGYGYTIDGTNTQSFRDNIAAWKSDAYDKLIDEAYKAQDKDTRTEKLRAAEQTLLEECPVAPILYNQNFAFVGRKLKDVETNGNGHFVLTEARLKNYKKYLPKEDGEN